MKRLRRSVLAQSFERNVFKDSDHKRSWTALRKKLLSIYNDSADPITKGSERSVCFLEVLSMICYDEPYYVLCDQNGRTPSAFVHLLNDSYPLPKKPGPGSNSYSIEIACEGEILARE